MASRPCQTSVEGTATIRNAYPKWRDIWIPLLSTIVALAGVLTGAWLRTIDRKTQADLKKYELGFVVKQQAYAGFINSVADAFVNAYGKERG